MRTYSAWWTAAVMLGCAGASHGATFDYCVRGSGLELQKTVRVKLELQGADPGADASRIAAALLRRLLWEGKAERVTVAVFDVRGCAAAHRRCSQRFGRFRTPAVPR